MTRGLAASEFASALERLGPFESSPHFAVAVSGGADSMALLHLAKAYADAHSGTVTALTVDHGLRKESAAEARQVAKWAKALGAGYVTLRWKYAGRSNLQAAAREGRYRLMAEWCRANDVFWLLAAHHRDDQMETLELRRQRSATEEGLSGMAPLAALFSIHVLRPLLAFPKSRLIATLQQCGQEWIEDPSNHSQRFARNRLRGTKLRAPAASAAARRRRMEEKLTQALVKHVQIFPGWLAFSPALLALPDDLALRALARMLTTISGEAYPPRLATLQHVLNALRKGKKTSAHGCMVWPRPNRRRPEILMFREPAACAGALRLIKGQEMLWDQRFLVRYEGKLSRRGALQIRPLGTPHARRLIEALPTQHRLRDLPMALISTFPALWQLESVLCAPHIGFMAREATSLQLKLLFRPAKPLGNPAFCVID